MWLYMPKLYKSIYEKCNNNNKKKLKEKPFFKDNKCNKDL